MDARVPHYRLIAAAFDWWDLSRQIAETLMASKAVIATRMAMLNEGMRRPNRAPVAEISRLLPEKVAAFGKAGAGAAQKLASPASGASGDGLVPAWDSNMSLFSLFERSLAAGLAWWQPLHAISTANARRLRRRRI